MNDQAVTAANNKFTNRSLWFPWQPRYNLRAGTWLDVALIETVIAQLCGLLVASGCAL